MKTFALGTLLALAALPATALVPRADEVKLLVEMPLAVTSVADYGVPAPEVERVVWQLNEAEVPVADTVEIVRYTPFPLVLTEYRLVETTGFETTGFETTDFDAADVEPGVDWDLDELDMLVLLQAHLDDGLRGELLGSAVLADLLRLGFDAGSGDRWRDAPRPVERDFVYYLTPGYRFDSDRGLFRDRVVVVDQDDLGFRRDGDRWLPDPERYRLRDVRDRDVRDRDVIVRREGRDDRGDRDGRAAGPPAVPPGHAKHGPGGPHPTPGHVKHAGPDGPPGHARHDDRPRARGKDDDRGNRGAARNRGNERGGPPAKAGKPDKGGGGKAKGNQGRGNGKGKGNGKGGGNGRG